MRSPFAADVRILGCRVDPVGMAEALERITGFLRSGRPAHVVTLGAEMVMLALRERAYQSVINGAELVAPDTVGIVVASRLLGTPLRERVAGIELVERLCELAAFESFSVYLLGGANGVAKKSAAELSERHRGLRIAGTHHGYFTAADDRHIVAEIRNSGANIVLVALGFPRQEYWIARHLPELSCAVCIGVGGTLDILAGKLKRAPLLMRRLGLEWLYRLLREPRRLRRQLILPAFATRVLIEGFLQRVRTLPRS